MIWRLVRAGRRPPPDEAGAGDEAPIRWWAPTRLRTVTALATDVLGLVISQPSAGGTAGHTVWLTALVTTVFAVGFAGWAWPRLPRPTGRQWATVVELGLTLLLLVPFGLVVHCPGPAPPARTPEADP